MAMTPARRRTAAVLWMLLPLIAIGGWFFPYLGLFVIICMLAPMVVAIRHGRHWCGWLCPRGAFFDYLLPKFSRQRPAPAWLRTTAFRIGILALLMVMMGVQLVMAYPNGAAMSRVFVLLLGVTSVVGIILAVAFNPRTWCTFCPMGSLAGWISAGKHRLQVADSCRKCAACVKPCPMQLTPFQPDGSHIDCVKCGMCVSRCPVKALQFGDDSSSTD